MQSLNRVTLIGNLAADPEVRETSTGKKVANFALATNRKWNSPDGEKKHATDYHKVVAWHKLGEICGEYLKKGSSVYLEGLLKNSSYENDKGETKYVTEIIANNVNILTWKKNKDGKPDAELESIEKEEGAVEE